MTNAEYYIQLVSDPDSASDEALCKAIGCQYKESDTRRACVGLESHKLDKSICANCIRDFLKAEWSMRNMRTPPLS